MFILDTNVVSETRKPGRHKGVMAWIVSTPKSQQFIAAVSFWEFQRGIDATLRQDPAKAAELQAWMDGLLSTAQVIAMDGAMFVAFHRLRERSGHRNIEDLMIAATALVADMVVVTRNTRDFHGLGVRVLDPWTFAGTGTSRIDD
jgi:predicted nucleic acid-binding protein